MNLSEEEISARAVPAELLEDITIANDRTCNIACTSCRKGMHCLSEEERQKIDDVINA